MTMPISKMISEKRRYRQYKTRTEELPADYHTAIDALERYAAYFGPTNWRRVTTTMGNNRRSTGCSVQRRAGFSWRVCRSDRTI
jgi:hypothetical protein